MARDESITVQGVRDRLAQLEERIRVSKDVAPERLATELPRIAEVLDRLIFQPPVPLTLGASWPRDLAGSSEVPDWGHDPQGVNRG